MGERRSACSHFVKKPTGKSHLEDLDLHGKIILKSILKKSVWRAWSGLMWLRI
jgi:hypothetical protein